MKRLSDEQVRVAARRGRAVGDLTRVRIVELLGRSEQQVGEVAARLDLLPSSVSKHLQVLFDARLVERRRSGNRVIYSIAHADLLAWCRFLASPDWSRPAPGRRAGV